jgi:branched-chain amino acid transport system ATP-binding protein
MVEQNAFAALELSDRSYVLGAGPHDAHRHWRRVVEDPKVKAAYLGA